MFRCAFYGGPHGDPHHSKQDRPIYRQGDVVVIARSDRVTCPVAMLKRYFALGDLARTPSLCLFRAIVNSKKGESLRKSGGLSYTRMRELVLDKMADVGYDRRSFGLHSFRAGGATAAANAPNLPDQLFKRHRR